MMAPSAGIRRDISRPGNIPELTDSSFMEPLRNFFWQDGSNYIWFTTVSQGLWIFVLLGILAEAVLLLVNAIAGFRKYGMSVREESSELLNISVTMIVIFIVCFYLLCCLKPGRGIFII